MKKKSDLGVQTAVRLPRDVHDRLKGSERGVSEEIRLRLQRTFDEDKISAPTRELVADIVELAEDVKLDQGVDWYSSDRAQEVFAVAVLARVKAFRTSPPGSVDLFRNPNDQRDPFTIGQTIEWMNRRRSANPRLRDQFQAAHAGMSAVIATAVEEHYRKKGDDDGEPK